MRKHSKQAIIVSAAVAAAALLYMVPRVNENISSTAKENIMERLTLDSFREKVCDCGISGSGNAEWKFKGQLPAVIDFYADWCGPCKMVSPILDELSREYEGRLNIYKVNTEEQRELAAMFGIRSIPSILFVPVDGQPTMAAGALPKKEFIRIFREVLGVEESVAAN